MSALSSVGQATVFRTNDAVSGSYFAVAPSLAVSAGHVFIAYDPSTDTISSHISETLSTSTGSIGTLNYLRNYDVRQNQKTPVDSDYDFEDVKIDIVTFDLIGGQFSTNDIVGLGVFIDFNDLVARQITAAGFPGVSLVTKTGSIESTTENAAGYRTATSNDIDIEPGMSGGAALYSVSELVGFDEQFAIGVNVAELLGDPRSFLTTFSLAEVYAIADLVAASGVNPDTLPRYMFAGSTIESDAPTSIDGTALRDLIIGGRSQETLSGYAASDEIYGGDKNDLLIADGSGLNAATAGADTLNGGDGIDTADYSSEDGSVNSAIAITDGGINGDGDQVINVTDTYGKTDTLISEECNMESRL